MKNFTHLHLHTSYSFNTGTIKIDDLIQTAKKENISSLAMTDYLNIFGAVKFYKKCIEASIKPIIGCEIPLIIEHNKRVDNIILLCQNLDGYFNLNKILSIIHKSRSSNLGATYDLIKKYNSNLICLSGGRNGLCGLNALLNPINNTQETIYRMKKIFHDRFYIELDRTSRNSELEYNNLALSIAKENDLPIVASNDVLFINDSDFEANEVKVSIIQKQNLMIGLIKMITRLTNTSNLMKRCQFYFMIMLLH